MEELVNELSAIRARQRVDKAREKELKDKLFVGLMEEVDSVETVRVAVSKDLASTRKDAISWAELRYGDTFIVSSVIPEKDGWIILLDKLKEYMSVEKQIGSHKVSKVVYSLRPDFDLDLLKQVDPSMWSKVTKSVTSYELDEEKLESYIKEDPTAIASLQKVVKAGDVRTRLDIK